MGNEHPDKETAKTWNAVSDAYCSKFMDLPLYDESYDQFLSLLKGHAVLDVCCGPGNISRYLKVRRPELRITGMDYAPKMIEWAKKHIPDGEFFCADMRNFSGIEDHFDGIICGFGIPYLSAEDTRDWILSAANLLAPNGVLYLSFVEGNPDQSGYKTGSSGLRTYFYYHPSDDIEKNLKIQGFKLVEKFSISYPFGENSHEFHTVLIAEK